MIRVARILFPLLLAVRAGATPAQSKPPPLPDPATKAEGQVKNRVISFSDENRASVPELHLAQGIPTTLVFPLNINEAATRLADSQRLIYKPQFFKHTAVLSPKSDLPAGALLPPTLRPADGTLLSFVLRTVPSQPGLPVTVQVNFHP